MRGPVGRRVWDCLPQLLMASAGVHPHMMLPMGARTARKRRVMPAVSVVQQLLVAWHRPTCARSEHCWSQGNCPCNCMVNAASCPVLL